jgi:hypothetical protein
VNWGEKPDEFPMPSNLADCHFIEKEDGSLAICDFVNGVLSVRSRGTVTAKTLLNYNEWQIFLQKYNIEKFCQENQGFSWLFEFVTNNPEHDILIKYPEIDGFLIGGIKKSDYSLLTQKELDVIAAKYAFRRPKVYNLNNIDSIKHWDNTEGVVVYSNNDQELHKVKTDFWLNLHRIKNNISFDFAFDFVKQNDFPSRLAIDEKLSVQFDHETCVALMPFLDRLYSIILDYNNKIIEIQSQLVNWVGSRKEIAQKILALYPNYSYIAFSILDGKLNNKILENFIKKSC